MVDRTEPRALSRLSQDLLPVLYQHRLMSTSQLQTLLQPHARTSQFLRRELAELRRLGLAGSVTRRAHVGQGELLTYVTAAGAELVEAGGEVPRRAYRISDQSAAGQLQAHTLAVNDVGVVFVDAARRRGEECGALDWEAELAHRVRDGEDRLADRAFFIPDAVLRYTHHDGHRRSLLTYFIELDRGTEHVSVLAAKLIAYARYSSYVPAPPPSGRGRPARQTGPKREAWRDRYPAFPHLLVVLTGRPDAVLARRIADLRALAAADPWLAQTGARLRGGVTTLQQLRARGPFAPIVTPLWGPDEPTDVLLQQKEVYA